MTDKDLNQHVQNALDWEPSVDARDIGVSVSEGVVTLRGNVPSYTEKIAAERIALHVYGTKAVANDLIVRLGSNVLAHDSEVVLSGNVHSWAERIEAERVAWADQACRTWTIASPSFLEVARP